MSEPKIRLGQISPSSSGTDQLSGNVALAGNLTFSGTGLRILGDLSSTPIANRLSFQNSLANTASVVGVIPNGTSNTSRFAVWNSSLPDNSSWGDLSASATEISIRSNQAGSGSYLPLTFYTGGSERVRVDTSGNVSIGVTSTSNKLHVYSALNNRVTFETGSGGGINYQRLLSNNGGGNYGSAIEFRDGSTDSAQITSVASGQLRFSTAGAERVTIDSSGNFGIGTTSPLHNLHVGDGANTISMTGVAPVLAVKGALYNTGFVVRRDGYAEAGIRSSSTGEFGTWNNYDMLLVTNGTERMRIDTSGRVGIGGTAPAYSRLYLTGTYPTSSNATQVIRLDGTIPSGTTVGYRSILSRPQTEATSFTLSNLYHFQADPQNPFGSGSVVTNQYGFHAESSITGATNNYGFFSNIASAANRWNFYANGTADNYFAGNVGIGTTSPGHRLDVRSDISEASAYSAQLGINSVTKSAGNLARILFSHDDHGSASIASDYESAGNGNLIFSTRGGGDPTERMRISAAGNVGIGGTADATTKLQVTGTLPTSGTVSRSILMNGTIPSGSTFAGMGIQSILNTQAASFTAANLWHFNAAQGTIGAGSSVTNQMGFYAESNLTGATNNFGFYSNIASGSNRWNFYANGTAANYFAGNVGIGTTSASTKLNVAGTSDIVHFSNPTGANIYQRWFNTGATYSPYIGTESENLVFGHWGSTERMRITSGGEVYIAGTTDQGAYNLQVNGTGIWAAGAYVNGSDRRLKRNIKPLDAALELVKNIKPVTFQYNEDYSKDQNVQPGFIAQELQEALNGTEYADGIVHQGKEYLNVAYQNLIPLLTKAIQELKAELDTAKNEIEILKNK